MLVFDFLGIDRVYNQEPSLCQIAGNLGMSCQIVGSYSKAVRREGETEKNLKWIEKVYPGYQFRESKDGRQFDVCIVKFCRK